MDSSWHSLLASAGVVALFIALWSHLPLAVDCSTNLRKIAFGALFGVGAIICMAFALKLPTGIILDLRNVLIVMASFIGGPLSGAISALLAGAYRFHLGGDSMGPALVLMAAVVVVGSLAHFRMKGKAPQRLDALGVAIVFTIVAAANYVIFPAARPTMPIMVETTMFRLITSLLAGLAMAKEVRRQVMARTNLIFGAITEALPDCLNVKDGDGKFVVANPATANLMHAPTVSELIGKSDFDFYPAAVAEEFKQLEADIIAARTPRTFEQFVTHRNGTTAWLSTLKVAAFDQSGRFQGLITHNRDISVRKRLEEELAQSREHMKVAFANMLAGVAMFDQDYRFVFCNDRYLEMFETTRDVRQPGARFRDIMRASLERGEKAGAFSPAEIDEQVALSEPPIQSPTQIQFEMNDGRWIDARINPTSGGYFGVYTDVTDLKRNEKMLQILNAQLQELAQIDALTGLQNRRSMDAFLNNELAHCARGRGATSLLLIDADKFKLFNDTYGHPGGDDCLQRVAQCLKDTVRRTTDCVARYGGEEFAAILSGTGQADAMHVAELLRKNVQSLAIEHSGNAFGVVTISIGVVTIPPGTNVDRLTITKLADEALYRAKAAGRNQVVCAEAVRPVQPDADRVAGIGS